MIKTGDVVPADVRHFLNCSWNILLTHISQLRLTSVSNLEISEQLLTGESVPGKIMGHIYPDYI